MNSHTVRVQSACKLTKGLGFRGYLDVLPTLNILGKKHIWRQPYIYLAKKQTETDLDFLGDLDGRGLGPREGHDQRDIPQEDYS